LALTFTLTLTAGHSELQLTTSIVVSEVGGTVPNDMGHDETVLQAQNMETAALSLFNNDASISYLSLTLLLCNR